ncbi:Permease of the drug/metabolite transporter (DMT) superfamily [hydrothermal vent metagenome]|uniref:Permease of the drug/metabolite transporter (DMT) superfamily n=1 Tax=hydrothermal vent metagenome TaxID=652676 RepID=A0A3B1A4H2_9ZZZZ
MSVPAAYLGIIIIWSTTPLAIQWSSEEVGFLFGVTARMGVAVTLCLILLVLLRLRLSWTGSEKQSYIASALGIYGAMICVYWGAQFIPSGLISVVYGLFPLVTTIMAPLWLKETLWHPGKWVGVTLAIIGLIVIFDPRVQLDTAILFGVSGVLASVFLHAMSMLWVKQIGANVNALKLTTGGLVIAAPLYLITWFVMDGQWPTEITFKTGSAILYLGIIGSVVGFFLFYYALKHLPADAIAITTLITPVTALSIGHWVNGEQLTPQIFIGTAIILTGLVFHQWGGRLLKTK